MADTEIRKTITQQHPDYASIKATCDNVLSAYSCDDTLFTKDFIHRHVFEDKKQFETRIKRAFTLSFLQNVTRKLVNKLYAGRVVRYGTDLAALRQFLLDATGCTVSYDQFMRNLCAAAITLGRAHVMVDYSVTELEKDIVGKIKVIPGALEGENPQPNLRLFTPSGMTNWNYIPRYGYEACIFKIKKVVEGSKKDFYLYVDYEVIEEYDSAGSLTGTFKHNLGYTPVFTAVNHDINGDPMAMSNALVKAQVSVTNLCSITDEIAERHAFSQLTCPDDGTIAELSAKESDYNREWIRLNASAGEIEDGDAMNGTDRVLRHLSQSSVFTFPANTGHPPAFISPDATQLAVVWGIAKDVMTQASVQLGMFDSAGNVDASSSAPYLSGMADTLTGIEKNILSTCLRYVGVQTDAYTIVYPNFATPADTTWMDTADRISGSSWLSMEAKKNIVQDLLNSNLDSMPVVDKTSLANAVEITDPVAEAARLAKATGGTGGSSSTSGTSTPGKKKTTSSSSSK